MKVIGHHREKEGRTEARKQGRKYLFDLAKYTEHDGMYNTIVSAWEIITKTAMQSQSWWPPQHNTNPHI